MKARHLATLVIATVILLSMAACTLPGLPTGDPLKGTSWRLVLLGGSALIPGTEITATFEDEQVHGSACNSYGGSYQVSGDKLTVRDLFMTEMACVEPQGIMDQERQYLELLGIAKTFSLTETRLEIVTGSGETLTFRPGP